MPAPAAFARRQFPGAAADTTISAGINNSDTSCSLASTSGWPTGAYTGGILCELYSTSTGLTLEKVWATNLTGSTLTIVRAADGSSATTHASGTGIRPVAGAIDADEANKAAHETVGQVTTAGDLLVGDGANSLTRLAIGASARILQSNGTTAVWNAVSGDVTISAAGAVTIGNDKIDSQHYVDGSIDTAHIADSQITNAKMADDAVDSAEIADGAIDLVHMSANSVDSDQYVDGSIDGVHIANDAIDSQHYADGSIDTAHIANDQVTNDKLAASAKARWMLGPFTSSVGTGDGYLGAPGGGAPHIPIPEACAVVGISVALENARSAGSATFTVHINGSTTGFATTIDDNPTQYATATQAETEDAVAAGDRIAVHYDTTGLADGGAGGGFSVFVLLQAV